MHRLILCSHSQIEANSVDLASKTKSLPVGGTAHGARCPVLTLSSPPLASRKAETAPLHTPTLYPALKLVITATSSAQSLANRTGAAVDAAALRCRGHAVRLAPRASQVQTGRGVEQSGRQDALRILAPLLRLVRRHVLQGHLVCCADPGSEGVSRLMCRSRIRGRQSAYVR